MEALSLSTLRSSHFVSGRRGVSKHLLASRALILQSSNPQSMKPTVSLSNPNPKHSETELVLDRAQQDLTELCKTEEGLECWKALSYFVSKRQRFEQHCNLELDAGEHDPEACTSLNSLEKFVREQICAGSVRNLRNNLLIMQRVEERRAEGGATTSAAPALTEKEVRERACLIRLFHALDADGDGEIGMLEFQDGMEALGAVLTEDDMRQISEAAGNSKNRLDIDEFIEVLEASPVLHGVALGDDSNFLRHAAHVHGTHHMRISANPTTKVA